MCKTFTFHRKTDRQRETQIETERQVERQTIIVYLQTDACIKHLLFSAVT